jgi:hypothetical protein
MAWPTERRGTTAARERRGGAPVVSTQSGQSGELLLAEGFLLDLRKRTGDGQSKSFTISHGG